MPREFVFRNRQCYSAYFVLAVIEMLKYSIKEDYESSRTEINLIPITLEYLKFEKKGKKSLPQLMSDSSKKKKKQNHLKQKQINQKYEDSSEDSDEFQNEELLANQELFDDDQGSFYLKFKEGIPGLVRKDMMVDDLWLLFKRPLVTNQGLNDIHDMVLAKSSWHFNSK